LLDLELRGAIWGSEEGTGTRPDYLVNRADKKNSLAGATREKNCTDVEK